MHTRRNESLSLITLSDRTLSSGQISAHETRSTNTRQRDIRCSDGAIGIQHIAIYNRVYVEWEEFKLTMKEESSSQFSRLEIERVIEIEKERERKIIISDII